MKNEKIDTIIINIVFFFRRQIFIKKSFNIKCFINSLLLYTMLGIGFAALSFIIVLFCYYP